MVAKAANAKKSEAVEGELLKVALKDIDPSGFQNTRTGDLAKGEAYDHKTGQSFSDLKESIKSQGQLEPALVRPKGKKWQLVAGWRRYLAIKEIAQATGDKNPTMIVISKPLDDMQALIANLGENSREPLTGPDLGHGVWRLSEEAKARGQTLSSRQIANIVGKHHSYVADLLTIFYKAPAVAKKWHDAPVQLTYQTMLRIAKIEDKSEQMAEYKRLLAEASEEPEEGGKAGKPWLKTAMAQADRIGGVLGTLVQRGCITVNNLDWPAELEFLGVKIKKDANAKDRKRIAKSAADAFALGLEPPEVDETEAEQALEEAAE